MVCLTETEPPRKLGKSVGKACLVSSSMTWSADSQAIGRGFAWLYPLLRGSRRHQYQGRKEAGFGGQWLVFATSLDSLTSHLGVPCSCFPALEVARRRAGSRTGPSLHLPSVPHSTWCVADAWQMPSQCVANVVSHWIGGGWTLNRIPHSFGRYLWMFAVCQALIWAPETQRHSFSARQHHYRYPVGFLVKDILSLPQGLCICCSCFLRRPSLQLSSPAQPAPAFCLHKYHLLVGAFSGLLSQTRLDSLFIHTWYFSFINFITTALRKPLKKSIYYYLKIFIFCKLVRRTLLLHPFNLFFLCSALFHFRACNSKYCYWLEERLWIRRGLW